MIALIILSYFVAGIFVGRIYNAVDPLEGTGEALLVVLFWPAYAVLLTLMLLSVIASLLVGVRRW